MLPRQLQRPQSPRVVLVRMEIPFTASRQLSFTVVVLRLLRLLASLRGRNMGVPFTLSMLWNLHLAPTSTLTFIMFVLIAASHMTQRPPRIILSTTCVSANSRHTGIHTLPSITYVSHTLATFNIFRVVQPCMACRPITGILKHGLAYWRW